MRLYSLQSSHVLKTLKQKSFINGEHPYSMKNDPLLMGTFENAYRYMQQQMHQRLTHYSGELPIWAFTKKHNLRRYVWDIDEPHILLFLDIPQERVLLSDFGAWSSILNNTCCTRTEKEAKSISEMRISQEKRQSTWHNIFNIEPRQTNDEINWLGKKPQIQACVDRIYSSDISDMQHIKPHPRRKRSAL